MNLGSETRSLLPLSPGSPALALPLSIVRSPALSSSPPRQISSQPWGPGARRRANGEGSPSAPRSPGGEQRRPGYAGGGTYPATGENEWGSDRRGAGREEPGAGVYSEECFVRL